MVIKSAEFDRPLALSKPVVVKAADQFFDLEAAGIDARHQRSPQAPDGIIRDPARLRRMTPIPCASLRRLCSAASVIIEVPV